MSDQEFEQTQQRLHAADPATGAPDPNVAAIRERVLAQTSTADNVVHLRRRRRALVIGSIAAGVALLAGTAVAGAAVGRVTAPVTEAGAPVQQVPEDQLPVVGAPQVSGQLPTVGGNAGGGIAGGGMGGMATGNNLAAGGGPGAPMPMGAPQESGVAGSASTVTSDKMMAPIWGGWGASLVPDPGLSDEAGTAKGYRLVADGVDAKALAEQLAKTFDEIGRAHV